MWEVWPEGEAFGHRLRPLAVADVPEVLRIEQACFPRPWDAARLRRAMARPDAVGRACETGGAAGGAAGGPAARPAVAGYVVCTLEETAYVIRRVAVDPKARRRGVATALVTELQRHAAASERLVRADVPERAIEAQLFFKRLGFACDRGRPGGREQVYRFVWSPLL